MTTIPNLSGTVYFASDLHLGIPDYNASLEREKRFVRWLDQVQSDASAIFIVGDLFDFWFEYRQVVPKGYVRVLGKLAALRDKGIPVYFFTGNHDQWMRDYFQHELGIPVFHEPQRVTIGGKQFLIAHGDGLGPGDHGYKFLKTLFRGRFSRWLFGILHPDIGVWLGKRWSKNNRLINGNDQAEFMGEEKEWLVQFARTVLKTDPIDYFIFGHRHIVLEYQLTETSKYINLGDWIKFNSYAVFDGKALTVKLFES
ncbi:MAG: UDP-2,3-diacylglucosamine diphosphatase [Chitinophagaceae bacterium]|nr:UDP-2,3-diacylglucosamine diphosphatase [Chitinophagaceae bacterium]